MALTDKIAKASFSQSLPSGSGSKQPGEAFVIPGAIQDLPKPKPFAEIGVTGLLRTKGVGYVYEEWLLSLDTYRQKQVYREMRDNDAVIGAMFYALEMILRKAEWKVEPAPGPKGDKYAEFVEQCMKDMSHTWEDFVAECVNMFAFGYALFETVYKRRLGPDGRQASQFDDGLIGWRKHAPRAQESILYWIWDDEGGLQGAVQLAAPDYHTVPIPIEKLLLFRTTSIKNNPEGRSILRNCYRCFDDETEILTKAGWKFGIDLTGKEEVAVLKDGFLQYEVPSENYRYEYNGDLIHFESKYLNQVVTPNHELWARKYGTEEYKRMVAEDVPLSAQVKRDAKWVGKEEKFHIIPAYDVVSTEQNGRVHVRNGDSRPAIKVPMDDWLRFLGIWVAEGGVSKEESRQGVTGVTQNVGKKANIIKKWMDKLPFHVGTHIDARDSNGKPTKLNFGICDRQLWDHIRRLGKTKDKYVPQYVKNLSSRQISIFLEAFHLGDGGYSGADYDGPAGHHHATRSFATSSDQLADDLCELILKSGKCPTKKRVKIAEWHPSENSKCPPDEWISAHEMWTISEGQHTDCRIKKIYREKYKGLVWCVETKAGVVYIRRNGKCQWSGNSWFFKRRIEEVEGIGIERDLCGIPVLYATAEALSAMGGDQAAIKLVTNIRQDDQAGVVLPLAYDEKGNPLVKLELLKTAGPKQTDPDKTISRYNVDLLNTMLAGFVQFGNSPTGSRSLHMSATQIYSLSITAFMDSVAAVMNRIAIPRLLQLNKMDLTKAPKLVPGDIGVRDLEELSQYIFQLSQSGITFFDQPTQSYIRKIARLPDVPQDEDDTIIPAGEEGNEALPGNAKPGEAPEPGATPGTPGAPQQAPSGADGKPGARPPVRSGSKMPTKTPGSDTQELSNYLQSAIQQGTSPQDLKSMIDELSTVASQ